MSEHATPMPKLTGTAPDPTPVFQALDTWITGTNFTNSNASVMLDGSGTSHTMNAQDRQGNSVTYTERTAGVRVTINPVTSSLGPSATQQFTATATNPDGSSVATPSFTWSLNAGALGSVSSSGLYTAPGTIAAASTDVLTCTLSTQQSWAMVNVNLHP